MNPDARSPVAGYAFGPFRIAVDERQIWRGDQLLPLTGKPFETLLMLVGRHGQIVDKDTLLDEVWPDTHVSEDSLTQSISVVRRTLGEDPSQPQFIATIPRRGYRFIAAVRELTRPAPSSPPVASAPLASVAPPALLAPPTPAAPAWGWRSLVLLGLPVAVVLLVFARTDTPRAIPNERPVRFELAAAPGTTLASGGALAPDGRHVAFIARDATDGKMRVWVRPLGGAAPRPLPGTEGAVRPFWSPDGQFLAYFADGRLKKVGLRGAPPQTLATVGYHPSGGTWSRAGVLLYADRMSRIYSVSEAGDGTVTPLTTLDPSRQELAHYAPQFLPDGRSFLFTVDSTNAGRSGTHVASLDDPAARTRLLDRGAAWVTFAAPDHLVYVRDRTLMAQPFDAARRRLSGSATPIGDGMASRSATISAAAGGLLAFGGDTTSQHLVWFDRTGRQGAALAATEDLHNPALSPDERQLLGDRDGIWLVDLDRGATTRLTQGTLAAWAHDGQAALFTTRRIAGAVDILARSVTGEEDERLIVRSKEMKLSGGWSRDGRHFVYVGSDPETRLDIWTVAAGGQATPRAFLRTPTNEMQPQLSPDGRWIAYASDESGAWEVYVQSFPTHGAKRAISIGGGAEPLWTKEGRELVYLRPDGTMMAVDVSPGADALQASRPRPLFRASIGGDITRYRNHYVVSGDGQRFLIDTADESSREPLTVVVHWQSLLGQ